MITLSLTLWFHPIIVSPFAVSIILLAILQYMLVNLILIAITIAAFYPLPHPSLNLKKILKYFIYRLNSFKSYLVVKGLIVPLLLSILSLTLFIILTYVSIPVVKAAGPTPEQLVTEENLRSFNPTKRTFYYHPSPNEAKEYKGILLDTKNTKMRWQYSKTEVWEAQLPGTTMFSGTGAWEVIVNLPAKYIPFLTPRVVNMWYDNNLSRKDCIEGLVYFFEHAFDALKTPQLKRTFEQAQAITDMATLIEGIQAKGDLALSKRADLTWFTKESLALLIKSIKERK